MMIIMLQDAAKACKIFKKILQWTAIFKESWCLLWSTEMNRWRIVKDKIENPLKDVWKIYTQTKSQVQQVSSIHNNFTVTLY